MTDKTDNSVKSQHPKSYLFIGIVWLTLGLFGLIFDPTKKLIIIIQIIFGAVIIIYYFWLKFK